MIIKAYAKINLSLDVVGKRDDGYHLLEMVMQQIDLYDVIEIHSNSTGMINVTCDKKYVPCDERNLAYKAAALYKEKYNIKDGVSIGITKNIPVSAGLAGGSTDAAAVLKAMRRMFPMKKVSHRSLKELGLMLGADVPYCIQGGTALCKGIGENVKPLNSIHNVIVVLVKPNFGISTKDIYGKLQLDKINKHPATDEIVKTIKERNIRALCYNMKNVLENVAVGMHPQISGIKKEMMRLGAEGALMSGSGPSVFGIFPDMLTAQRAFEYFKQFYNEVFITRSL
ncbi:4-diphosphocytidyl-2-C-methyl-D-erythritol kinase [Hathewaya proteolytica DSM 3090]|uniref:4-diphosphocytidyl-2-C-methyl-D-erythritol kinase n=1 Tax=Hathewaya proteolytica DSM 3090 TaxID=1121331 RepID=A0A1M6S7I0_9CLOT|nr:4-(cytidine 5'-diphospho)-2-C-methyl-D-erythritol kinase [Hathewaya proteolytica]SHK40641.1 4-diphosphocytidyl-2-C-methyl-D-erythritol kinase [Hathewaya proteolytica DSM 3090]